MSGLGGIIFWDAENVPNWAPTQVTRRMAHRGPDGLKWTRAGNAVLAQAHLLTRKDQVALPPIQSPVSGRWIVADAEIFNRSEILDQLAGSGWANEEASDTALVLAAFDHWEASALDLLDGDFAFAIWDEKAQRLFAARDPFGVRPFFYSATSEFFAFGSEPKQLLALPGVAVEINDLVVGEYLFNRFEEMEQTFFTSVSRLRASHHLVAEPGSAQQKRYWLPDPHHELSYSSQQAYLDHFREQLKTAVVKRLRMGSPIFMQLSGGFDSSSLVVLADDLVCRNGGHWPEIHTVSGKFPGLECDESPFIDSVTEKTSFRSHSFLPVEENVWSDLEEDLWRIDSPLGELQRGIVIRTGRIVVNAGARVLLTGLGGDELLHQEPYLRDLATRRQWLTLARETFQSSRTSWNSFAWLFTDALKELAPDKLKSAYRRMRGAPWLPPAWATAELAQTFIHGREVHLAEPYGFASRTQECAYHYLTFPSVGWGLETLAAVAAHQGHLLSHPYLDRRLAESVLATPFEARIPAGHWKPLLARGLADLLPVVVRNRRRKTEFSSYSIHMYRRLQKTIVETLLGNSRWESEAYVSRAQAARLLRSSPGEPGCDSYPEVYDRWRIAALEVFLRRLVRYNAP